MVDFLNEHFGSLSVLFIVTLLITSEWKSNPSLEPTASPKLTDSVLFWAKIIVIMQGLILIVSILTYFKS